MYFTTRHIPELAGLGLQQRMQVIKQALSLISVPRKIMLNILKLLILTHLFSILARFEGWILIPYLLLAGLLYPLVINPLTFYLTRTKLASARQSLSI